MFRMNRVGVILAALSAMAGQAFAVGRQTGKTAMTRMAFDEFKAPSSFQMPYPTPKTKSKGAGQKPNMSRKHRRH